MIPSIFAILSWEFYIYCEKHLKIPPSTVTDVQQILRFCNICFSYWTSLFCNEVRLRHWKQWLLWDLPALVPLSYALHMRSYVYTFYKYLLTLWNNVWKQLHSLVNIVSDVIQLSTSLDCLRNYNFHLLFTLKLYYLRIFSKGGLLCERDGPKRHLTGEITENCDHSITQRSKWPLFILLCFVLKRFITYCWSVLTSI
jgi:hypothetical protein